MKYIGLMIYIKEMYCWDEDDLKHNKENPVLLKLIIHFSLIPLFKANSG